MLMLIEQYANRCRLLGGYSLSKKLSKLYALFEKEGLNQHERFTCRSNALSKAEHILCIVHLFLLFSF